MTGERLYRLPQAVKNNVGKGLRLKADHAEGTVPKSEDLIICVVQDQGIPMSLAKTMDTYFKTYDSEPSIAGVAAKDLTTSAVGWLLYGGKAGMQWASRITKDCDENGVPQGLTVGGEILKVDDELGLVMGYAIVSTKDGEPYFDKQDDHIPDESMLRASVDFMKNSRTAKEMHAGSAKGTVVFAWPMTAEIAKAFDIETKTTGLMIAMLPDDEEVLEKFKSGEYTGFSIGGSRIDDEEVEDDG